MTNKLQTLLNGTLAIAALTIAVSAAHREFRPSNPPIMGGDGPPQRVENWRHLASQGTRVLGDPAAAIQVVAFSDFECPFCREFHQDIMKRSTSSPSSVSFTLIHFPLAMHRFAKPAAALAECAKESGHFREVADLLYAKQDSFGLKSWASYANEAGVADTTGLSSCMSDARIAAAIDSTVSLGKGMGIHGTPTVIVNGWRLAHPPSVDSLQAIASSLGEMPR